MAYSLELSDHEIELLAKANSSPDGCHYMPNKKTFDGLRKKGMVDLIEYVNPAYYPNAITTVAGRALLQIIEDDKDLATKAG